MIDITVYRKIKGSVLTGVHNNILTTKITLYDVISFIKLPTMEKGKIYIMSGKASVLLLGFS
jgi:hypothetical protein